MLSFEITRTCKFPLVCGNTILHEEAFCYHRGTHCEQIFENNQRDFLASGVDANNDNQEDEDIEYFEDYVDRLNKDQLVMQHESEFFRKKLMMNDEHFLRRDLCP